MCRLKSLMSVSQEKDFYFILWTSVHFSIFSDFQGLSYNWHTNSPRFFKDQTHPGKGIKQTDYFDFLIVPVPVCGPKLIFSSLNSKRSSKYMNVSKENLYFNRTKQSQIFNEHIFFKQQTVNTQTNDVTQQEWKLTYKAYGFGEEWRGLGAKKW